MATVRTLIGNIKGPKGDTGATGATGPQGPGATINVGTVSTTAYGNPVQITNSGTETDAVLDFVIPQGKPGEQTTKMSLLTLDTITTQTAEYPIPAVGDVGSTAWGKIVKFFNDIKTAVTGKVDKTSIVNNLTSTATDSPLSANMGKTINDAITSQTNYIKRVTISGAPVGADGSLYVHVPLNFRYALVVLRGVSSNGTAIYMSACCMTNYSNVNEIQVLHKVSDISNAVMTYGSTTGHPVILLTLSDKYKSTTIDLGISVVACALK